MSIKAMKLALEAIQDLRGYRPDIDKAIETLRTTLSQQPDNASCKSVQKRLAAQQPATGEPVAWKYQPQDGLKHPAFTEHEAIAIAHGKDGSVVPLCTHQAPSVPGDVMRDAERYRWLRNEVVDWYVGPSYATYNDVVLEGEYKDLSAGGVALDSAIDAAMLAAKDTK